MNLTQTLNDSYQEGVAQNVEIYAKKPDGSKVLLATFKTDLANEGFAG